LGRSHSLSPIDRHPFVRTGVAAKANGTGLRARQSHRRRPTRLAVRARSWRDEYPTDGFGRRKGEHFHRAHFNRFSSDDAISICGSLAVAVSSVARVSPIRPTGWRCSGPGPSTQGMVKPELARSGGDGARAPSRRDYRHRAKFSAARRSTLTGDRFRDLRPELMH
jgi:hypothetical protein